MNGTTTFLPSYDPCPEYNARLLQRSIPMMMKHQVSTHPINYAIWYEYVAGNNGKLTAAIDELLKSKQAFDDETSLSLYKNYICNASVESFEKINYALQALIENTANTVQDSSTQVASVGEHVSASSLKLEGIDNLSDVKNVLSGIVAETRELLKISNILKTKLNEANDEMARLRSELSMVREMATTDGLTGLLNRRAFDEILVKLIDSPLASSHCLLILDLDYFKKINDRFGHLVGDKVLRYMAGLLKQHASEHHHVARFGGEELAVVMPETTMDTALAIAEQIRSALDNSRLKQKESGQSIGKVTVSIGAASLKNDDSVESFVARADQALYAAKESGRNRVVHLL
ncbi:GGDEF domain-containing protein [Methylomarinum sp. Ch1-1]|uniref:diguanylate cyclase n=1 Tax=Methylomarinum roseum TaxID=3067653 RepID=A0AAU7NYZ9_9GAMM|nr:GGDEF domain-containing protein [Methylomarinum sp. Ch1-1]MDP4522051.1 GGDEF domain-containing protein [Methylomarinum sp. Ch1-1]